MEEDLFQKSSLSGSSATAEKITDRLKRAVDQATETIEYEEAHNGETLHALEIVKRFLRRRGRVCYGGTAMNEILPAAKRFYDPNVDLPDYDFFSPDVVADTEELVAEFRKAGFTDVYSRVGMHAGTKKILVNFRPIADMSTLDPDIYGVFVKRAVVKDGVRYTDPDVLRMMMYLELSRPKGEVGRWEKVFERLQLLNSVFRLGASAGGGGGQTRKAAGRGGSVKIPASVRRMAVEYCIESGRVLLSGPIEHLYEAGIRGRRLTYADPHAKGGEGPVVFLTPALKEDAEALKQILERGVGAGGDEDEAGAASKKPITFYLHKARGEIVSRRIELRRAGKPVALLVEDSACHAYNPVPYKGQDGRQVLIASPETMITEYIAMAVFTKPSAKLYEIPPMVRAARMLALSEKNYRATHSIFPAFALSCKGYQKGYPTLLREKVARTQREKNAAAAAAATVAAAAIRRTRRRSASKEKK